MKKTIVTLLAVSLVACGGGGSDESAPETIIPTPVPTPTPVDVMPIGLWEGNVNVDGVDVDIVGMIAPSGEARFISEDGEQNRFNLILDDKEFTGKGVSYDYDGTFLGNLTVSGDYTPTSITGTSKSGEVITSTFALSINDESKDGASLSTVTGNYVDSEQSASIAIDSAGVLSGSDDNGCIYNGNVTVPESSVNVYSLSIDVSSCAEFSGSYTGLATYALLFNDSSQKGFIFQIDNDNYLVTDVLIK